MADRSIVVRLRAEIADFKKRMGESAQSAKDAGSRIGDSIQKNSAALNDLSNKAGLLGAAMVAAAGFAVKAYADFDAAMSSVQASTMESADNMVLLRDAALEAGERTVYSATEAAAAIEELAKAGVSTADILGGGLDGALDLAAAGGIAVADAAETAASAMTQFGLEGKDVTHIADLLAAGAGKAQGGVSEMGQALNQAGLVASQMGLSIEETVGSLTAFASAGLVGSDAGTSFRAMLLRLANPTGESARLMEELGINAYDAGGEFVGMESLAGQLASQLGDLTQAERNQALAQIFGQDAIRTSAILYEKGAEGVAEWTAAVDEQGYAAEVAAMKLNNLKGDIEALGGSVETTLIGFGEAGDGPMRTLVQSATEVVNALGAMPEAAQGALMAIVGGGGLALLGVAGIAKIAVSVSELTTSFKGLGRRMKITAGVASAALGIAAIALMTWADRAAEARAKTEAFKDTLDDLGNTTDVTVDYINELLSTEIDEGWLAGLFGDSDTLIDRASKFGVSIEDMQGYITGAPEAIERLKAALDEYGGDGSDAASQIRIANTRTFLDLLDQESEELSRGQKEQGQKALADKAAGVAQGDLADEYRITADAIEEQTSTLEALIDAQREASGVVASVMEAQASFEEATDAATLAVEASIEAGVAQADMLDITTEAGRDNQDALLGIRDAGFEVVASMEANGATQEELQGAMADTRQRFLDTAVAMGLSSEEANALADELHLIPENITTAVTVDTSSAHQQIANLKTQYDGMTLGQMYFDIKTRNKFSSAQAADAARYTGMALTYGKAEGGYISGPGTGTSDSIPARLSNGEYVIKAAAVSQYGTGFFDSLNAQRFASGGYVGGGSAASAGASSLAGPTYIIDGLSYSEPLPPEVVAWFSTVSRRAQQKAGVSAQWARA